jgi:demethylspheroidene O-methyltransferase
VQLPRAWQDRFTAWRNALVARPSFQRWAAGFVLTRPIAHASAQSLFDLVAGFVYSQVLVACVELGLLDALSHGPLRVSELAAQSDVPQAGMKRLLQAAQALGIVEEAGPDRFALGMKGAALLGNGGLTDMIVHHRLLYADLADPVAMLRAGGGQGEVAAFWPYAAYDNPAGAGGAAVSPYSRLMAATQPMVAADILHAFPLSRFERLLDVGGGEGAFARAAAQSAPHLRVGVFDLPAVARRAQAAFETAGLTGRATALGGDFLSAPLPKGADVISLVRILHDHDNAAVMTILRAAHEALPDGGTLLIGEPMSAAPRPDPMAEAYFGMYLFAMGRGQARRPDTIANMVAEAGFKGVRQRTTRTPMLVRVMTAQAEHR